MERNSLADVLGAPRARFDAVAGVYDGMGPADRITFREAIQNPDYTHAQIATALREMGYNVDRKQVQYYRERLARGKVSL